MKALVLREPHALTVEERQAPEPDPGTVRVRVSHGGICGSDIHYYLHGGFGTVRMKSPMVLGHELAGTVESVGANVRTIEAGQRVAINPSLACGACGYCRSGMPRMCADMRFMGSAMRTPHVEGGFRELVVCTEAQSIPIGDGISFEEAALGEPLAVAMHAVAQVPDLSGQRVLVSGFGPIGALTFLASRHAGASELLAADIATGPLVLARSLNAAGVYNAGDPAALDHEKRDRGMVDVVFECSGHPAAIQQAIDVTKPGGTIIQVGMSPDQVTLALNPVVTKELTYRGTWRFDTEFERAIELISSRQIDVRPIISRSFPMNEATSAFEYAMDRERSVKVLLDFN